MRAINRMLRNRQLVQKRRAVSWSVTSLFTGGVSGLWLDPSDLTTMFQDSAGTTPVTALEQSVGLILDKSKGLVLGPELVSNGTFDSNINGWSVSPTYPNGTLSWVAGKLRITLSAAGWCFAYVNLTGLNTSSRFIVTTTTSSQTTQFAKVIVSSGVGGSPGSLGYDSGNLAAPASIRSASIFPASTGSILIGGYGIAGQYVEFDNISVREIQGNHAFQSTSANRPMLSARYNLLTKTEDFSDAVWNLNSDTIVSTNVAQTTDPIGGNSADKLIASNSTNYHWRQQQLALNMTTDNYLVSIRVKAAEYSKGFLGIQDSSGDFSQATLTFDLVTKTLGSYTIGSGVFVAGSGSIVSLPDGWFEVSFIGRSGKNSATNGVSVYLVDNTGAASFQGNGTSGLYVWGASLVPANQSSLPYQRVNTENDYDSDATKFPWRLKFNGMSSSLQTTSINFTATDKMFVSAGVRKLSDGPAVIVEQADAGSNVQFTLLSAAAQIRAGAYRVSGVGTYGNLGATDSAPKTYVPSVTYSSKGTTAANFVSGRYNGVTAAYSADMFYSGSSTDVFNNIALNIGARPGSSLFLNGDLYQLVIAGKQASTEEITSTETYINSKTKAY